MRHVCVRLPDKLEEEARRAAEEDGYPSLSELIRELLRAYLRGRKRS